jgi:DNA-binding MarR family transcriptional regulator
MNRSKLPLFATLRALREFERRHLPFLQTLEDCDLVREIGYRQARGRPLTLKELMLLGLGSVSTMQRRLRRLRELKVIVQYRCATDRRAVALVLAPKVVKTIGLCEDLLRPAAAPRE